VRIGWGFQTHSSIITSLLSSKFFNRYEMLSLRWIRDSSFLSIYAWFKHLRLVLRAYMKAKHIHWWRYTQEEIFSLCVGVTILIATSQMSPHTTSMCSYCFIDLWHHEKYDFSLWKRPPPHA